MQDREATVRSRELGDALRTVMKRAGLTGGQVARRLGCSESTVSRLLSGKRGGSERDIIRFAAVC
jgi:transcriptional regulator with XRE-family HTH domain